MKTTDRELASLAARVGRRLRDTARCMATAESCTGGWIAKTMTDVDGSSEWFAEGFVTYSNEAKTRSLGVPRSVLARAGAVSEAVARAIGCLPAVRRTVDADAERRGVLAAEVFRGRAAGGSGLAGGGGLSGSPGFHGADARFR